LNFEQRFHHVRSQQARYLDELDSSVELHAHLEQIQGWQRQRLAQTYADFLQDEHYGAACDFFLTELYTGLDDVRGRDEQLARVMPLMQRLLPRGALDALVQALETQLLSVSLDFDMASHSHACGIVHPMTQEQYAQIYRETDRFEDRRRQIRMVLAVGDSLEQVVARPGLGTLLKALRGPAHAAGLGTLQGFLERGFSAFRAMPRPRRFLDAVEAREKRIHRELIEPVADDARNARAG